MRLIRLSTAGSLLLALMLSRPVSAQDSANSQPPALSQQIITQIYPDYVPPSEIVSYLGADMTGGRGVLSWMSGERQRTVEVRANEAANLLTISGPAEDVAYAEALARGADIAPRQIEIEVVLVEISKNKARDLGIDWEQVLDRARVSWGYYGRNEDFYNARDRQPGNSWYKEKIDQDSERQYLDASASAYAGEILKILDESGAGKVRHAPRILTLNNHPATLLDGERVTYVTRYSTYTNLYETETMDAGLTIKILPSLGASGYITLDITAELTALSEGISGSPVKDGQMLENTVIAKDGEPVLLGGLTRTLESQRVKRFPILGYVLPFLFSRTVTEHEEVESFIVLTPRVIDLGARLDETARAKTLEP